MGDGTRPPHLRGNGNSAFSIHIYIMQNKQDSKHAILGSRCEVSSCFDPM